MKMRSFFFKGALLVETFVNRLKCYTSLVLFSTLRLLQAVQIYMRIRRIPYLQVPQNGKSILFPDFSRKDQSNFAGTAYTYILWETEQLSLLNAK